MPLLISGDDLGPCLRAAALRAVRDDPLVLPRGLDALAPLEHVVAARLLHVDVLAGLAGPDRQQRVPVVAGGDGDRVEVLVFQGLADVLEALGLVPGRLLDRLARRSKSRESGSIKWLTRTPWMSPHSPMWAPPRPLIPATPICSVSLAPRTREEATIGTAMVAAATAEPFKNSRRCIFMDHSFAGSARFTRAMKHQNRYYRIAPGGCVGKKRPAM